MAMVAIPVTSAIPVISAVNVSKSFGTHKVLDDVSLDVAKGEVVCILGRSGSGKTTLLRCLNMLERPASGAVFLDGELMGFTKKGGHLHELPSRATARQRRRLGMVFQQFNLFPHMTEPAAMLFDEPTSALDPEMVSEVLQVIRSLAEEGRTIVIVTHEVGFAREICDRFVFMENGRIVEDGSPDVLISGGLHSATQEFMSKVL
jgi:polar amino acid transport system ATP-binding protein